MYAVIRTGGKQYKVAKNDVISVERLAGAPGEILELNDVLMLGDDGNVTVGAPTVSGACVGAAVLQQAKGDKILIFKKKRRHNYRRKNGHRQELTILRITEILTDGKKPDKTPLEAKAPKEQKPAAPRSRRRRRQRRKRPPPRLRRRSRRPRRPRRRKRSNAPWHIRKPVAARATAAIPLAGASA